MPSRDSRLENDVDAVKFVSAAGISLGAMALALGSGTFGGAFGTFASGHPHKSAVINGSSKTDFMCFPGVISRRQLNRLPAPVVVCLDLALFQLPDTDVVY